MMITKQWNRDGALHRTAQRELRPAAHDASLRQDMALAQRVQQSLLPALTPPPGLTVAACFHPAQAVGGDTYDFLSLPDGRLLVAIADVSGHGLSAALLSVVIQQGIRCLAQPDPTVTASPASDDDVLPVPSWRVVDGAVDTCAPGGTLNRNTEAAGRWKLIELNPVSNAGLAAPAA